MLYYTFGIFISWTDELTRFSSKGILSGFFCFIQHNIVPTIAKNATTEATTIPAIAPPDNPPEEELFFNTGSIFSSESVLFVLLDIGELAFVLLFVG